MSGSTDENSVQAIAKHFAICLESKNSIRFLSYPIMGESYNICETQMDDWEGYKLFFSTETESNTLFIYLTDSDVNPAAHLLSHLIRSSISGVDFYPEKVMTISDLYLNKHGFTGLIFFQPEDLEVFGNLKNSISMDDKEVQILYVFPLKKREYQGYKTHGIESIIKCLEREERDFFSVHS